MWRSAFTGATSRGDSVAGMISDGISLRALEVLDELARTGSMQEAAANLGLSPSAASQQLKNLERALGQPLVEHGRRPLALSGGGAAYLGHVRAALTHLHRGASELSLRDLGALRALRLGVIDDFDGEVTPRLGIALARMLSGAELTLTTAPSLRILDELVAREVDLGLAAGPLDLPPGVVEIPLLRDPFLLATPRGHLPGPPESLDALGELPLLRYEGRLLQSRQIASQLARLRLAPAGQIHLDSNSAIFALVANGSGWTISTPVGFFRARSFHEQIDLHRLPFASFSRTISLLHRPDWMPEIAEVVAESLRGILRTHLVEPGREAMPWIGDDLSILPHLG